MKLQITFLDPGSTIHGAIDLEFANYLIKAHIGLEPMWQILLTIWALLLSQLVKATLANDGSALLAVEWGFWQLETHNTLELFEAQFLRIQVVHLLLDLSESRNPIVDFMSELTLILRS